MARPCTHAAMARGGATSEIWSVLLGMMLIATSGVANTLMFTLQPVMQRRGLPFYFSVGTAQLLLSAVMAAAVWRSGQLASVEASKWKWVFLRGVTGGMKVHGDICSGSPTHFF